MVISAEEMEPKLAATMDAVPECEGLIYAYTSGEVIIGQTITEMDLAAIAENASTLVQTEIGKPTHKAGVKDVTIDLDKGTIIIVIKADAMILGLLGVDGKNSEGLLRRQLKQLL